MRPLHAGFYAHYHGRGHKHRTEAILQHIQIPATVITSRIATLPWSGSTLQEVVEIACDIDDVPPNGLDHARDVPALHYAPLWTDTITRRVAQYTGWIARAQPDVIVVDVSAEISMLTRLASVPQIVMRQHGDRSDPGHLTAYAAAHSVLAPFPRLMEDECTPEWVQAKTIYLDGFRKPPKIGRAPIAFTRPTIVVLFGQGGKADRRKQLAQAASAAQDYDWVVVGKSSPHGSALPRNLRYAGWTEEPDRYTANAEIVVTAAGHNSVMELGAARKRMIAIAEPRPFDEQNRKVAVLDREALAVGIPWWPKETEWRELIRRALALDVCRWNAVFASDGAQTAAEYITEVALWSRKQREVATCVRESVAADLESTPDTCAESNAPGRNDLCSKKMSATHGSIQTDFPRDRWQPAC